MYINTDLQRLGWSPETTKMMEKIIPKRTKAKIMEKIAAFQCK